MQSNASTAVTVNTATPGPVGVPVMSPAGDSVRPGGSEFAVTARSYGALPPEGVIVCVYGTPTWASGSVGGDSVMTGHATGST